MSSTQLLQTTRTSTLLVSSQPQHYSRSRSLSRSHSHNIHITVYNIKPVNKLLSQEQLILSTNFLLLNLVYTTVCYEIFVCFSSLHIQQYSYECWFHHDHHACWEHSIFYTPRWKAHTSKQFQEISSSMLIVMFRMSPSPPARSSSFIFIFIIHFIIHFIVAFWMHLVKEHFQLLPSFFSHVCFLLLLPARQTTNI